MIIASISHDIKTPLTSIMGFAERMKKTSLSPERHTQYLDIIYNKSVSIKNLIEDFDDYLNLHIHSGLKQQRISVDKFCAILRADYEAELMENGVDFSVRADCPDEFLFIDVSKMRRVFGNIIDNSLKHFMDQPPSIAVSCSKSDKSLYNAFQHLQRSIRLTSDKGEQSRVGRPSVRNRAAVVKYGQARIKPGTIISPSGITQRFMRIFRRVRFMVAL